MKYYGGCDSGSTYTKCVIIDETGKMVADVTLRSRINAVLSCEESIAKAVAQVPELASADDLAYLAGTGRFFEAMAKAFEMDLSEFSKLSRKAKNVIPITAQCTVFAESEVISLVGEGKPMDEIAAEFARQKGMAKEGAV